MRPIEAHTRSVRTAGSALRGAGSGLYVSAGLAEIGGLGGAESTPLTARALAMLSRDWSVGLRRAGEHLEALGTFADLTAAAFDVIDSR